MIHQNAVLVLNILQRDYPEIAGRIAEQISNALPAHKVADQDYLASIIEQFKEITGITAIKWHNQRERVACRLSGDEFRLCKVTEVREMLIAVVLMFYHPERLTGLDFRRVKPGLLLALASEIECDRRLLSQSLASAVTAYKAYKAFKTEVNHLYEHISNTGKYF